MAGLYPGVREAGGNECGEDGVPWARPRVSVASAGGGEAGPRVDQSAAGGAEQRGEVEHLVHHHVPPVHHLKYQDITSVGGLSIYMDLIVLCKPGSREDVVVETAVEEIPTLRLQRPLLRKLSHNFVSLFKVQHRIHQK